MTPYTLFDCILLNESIEIKESNKESNRRSLTTKIFIRNINM